MSGVIDLLNSNGLLILGVSVFLVLLLGLFLILSKLKYKKYKDSQDTHVVGLMQDLTKAQNTSKGLQKELQELKSNINTMTATETDDMEVLRLSLSEYEEEIKLLKEDLSKRDEDEDNLRLEHTKKLEELVIKHEEELESYKRELQNALSLYKDESDLSKHSYDDDEFVKPNEDKEKLERLLEEYHTLSQEKAKQSAYVMDLEGKLIDLNQKVVDLELEIKNGLEAKFGVSEGLTTETILEWKKRILLSMYREIESTQTALLSKGSYSDSETEEIMLKMDELLVKFISIEHSLEKF